MVRSKLVSGKLLSGKLIDRELCKIEVRHILFKKNSFFDFLK